MLVNATSQHSDEHVQTNRMSALSVCDATRSHSRCMAVTAAMLRPAVTPICVVSYAPSYRLSRQLTQLIERVHLKQTPITICH